MTRFLTHTHTGDALLTSLHVAKQVGICDNERRTLTLMGKQAQEVTAITVMQGGDNSGKKSGYTMSR